MVHLKPGYHFRVDAVTRGTTLARPAFASKCRHGFLGAVVAAARRGFAPTSRNVLHWSIWALALGVEVSLMLLLRGGEIYAWEIRLTRRLQDVPAVDPIFDVSSTLTNTLSLPFALLFIAILTAVWMTGRKLEVALLALSFPLHVLAQFPKALIDRPRPPAGAAGIEGVGGLQSFPSGHAEYVITFYGFLAFMLLMRFTGKAQRTAIVCAWLLFVLSTGFGRVAAGRHWPVDVLTSYVVGIGLLSGLVWLYFAFQSVKSARSDEPADRA